MFQACLKALVYSAQTQDRAQYTEGALTFPSGFAGPFPLPPFYQCLHKELHPPLCLCVLVYVWWVEGTSQDPLPEELVLPHMQAFFLGLVLQRS